MGRPGVFLKDSLSRVQGRAAAATPYSISATTITAVNPTWMASRVDSTALVYRRTAVDRPGPGNQPGIAGLHPRQPQGERHAHEKSQRGDERGRDHDPKGVRQPHRVLEQPRQQREAKHRRQPNREHDRRHRVAQLAHGGVVRVLRSRAADPGEQQEREQHDRHRVERVAQKQHELLDERDLDEHEGRTDRQKIDEHAAARPGARQRVVLPSADP